MELFHVFLLVMAGFILQDASATVVRRCEGGTLTISCPGGSIRINSANYGRTAGHAICPSWQIRTTNCRSGNSINIVKAECDGKTSCSVAATNGVFGDPCRGTYKYLQVDYTCVPLSCATRRTCEGGSLGLSCPHANTFLHICNAMYGRQTSSICPHSNIKTTNCRAASSYYRTYSHCQGKHACSISASNHVFGDPCRGTYKYLEVLYDCVKKGRVCEHHTLHLTCPIGKRLYILDAFYGRMAGPAVCAHPSIRTTNCRAPSSLGIVRSRCEGHRTCSVPASNGVFGDPCGGTYKYLEVLYDCA